MDNKKSLEYCLIREFFWESMIFLTWFIIDEQKEQVIKKLEKLYASSLG